MRVIAGIAKGRILKSVEGDTTRPITDRTKEALFNIIGSDIVQSSFLDCFAGTGSVGIEALSRGSSFARFIDQNPKAIHVIRENLKATGLIEKAEVLRMDVFAALARQSDRRFDYIYVAPPQYHELWSKMLILLDNHMDWLSDDGWIIVQIHPVEYEDLTKSHQIKNIAQFDLRKYGSTLLLFFERALSETG
jgi:16S rRNA (guanine(966)-N(2))-methyltransferase RsmD